MRAKACDPVSKSTGTQPELGHKVKEKKVSNVVEQNLQKTVFVEALDQDAAEVFERYTAIIAMHKKDNPGISAKKVFELIFTEQLKEIDEFFKTLGFSLVSCQPQKLSQGKGRGCESFSVILILERGIQLCIKRQSSSTRCRQTSHSGLSRGFGR